jgi:hypothetical protein
MTKRDVVRVPLIEPHHHTEPIFAGTGVFDWGDGLNSGVRMQRDITRAGPVIDMDRRDVMPVGNGNTRQIR